MDGLLAVHDRNALDAAWLVIRSDIPDDRLGDDFDGQLVWEAVGSCG